MNDEMRSLIMKNLPAYIASTNKNGTYPSRKNPKTYLYNSSWEDEIIQKEWDGVGVPPWRGEEYHEL